MLLMQFFCVLNAFRFGTSSAAHGYNTMKQSEENKRRARAERFRLAQCMIADEEAKKKARLSKFGAVFMLTDYDYAYSVKNSRSCLDWSCVLWLQFLVVQDLELVKVRDCSEWGSFLRVHYFRFMSCSYMFVRCCFGI